MMAFQTFDKRNVAHQVLIELLALVISCLFIGIVMVVID